MTNLSYSATESV